ncbi:hypothetical protein [Pedobacter alpinus]|uniref:Lipoprotein n=1 Tax=Pedobacter alpinus TaxID=1590643 RepID=A0ABW5TW03_9SPHI
MKTNRTKILSVLLGLTILASCKKDEPIGVTPITEHKYIRLMLSDANSTELTLVNPLKLETSKFNAKHAKSALYTTASGRFATLIHRDFNFIENFDSGFEFHGDHVDLKGTPKFASLTGTANKPTHFKSKGNEILTFNDGDGSLSICKEEDFHNNGAVMRTIATNVIAHHGAMTKFNNGNYAITVKDGSIAGSLPERVKIIDGNGSEVNASTIQTKGIHGNASNGSVSLFGSASGVLLVYQNGNQELIEHPSNFSTAWFGSILETSNDNKFIGYTAAMGAYLIDVTTKQITPIIENKDIMHCKLDYSNKNLIVMLLNGNLRIYNSSTGVLKKDGKVFMETLKTETSKPFLAATERFIYLVDPKEGEINQISTTNFSDVKKIKVSEKPFSITILGYENSQAH